MDSEIERVAQLAADKTVRQVFSTLGVDLADIESANSFRQDLLWARKARLFHEGVGSKIGAHVLVLLTGGALFALWDWLKTTLRG
jgi:hypothetical protein